MTNKGKLQESTTYTIQRTYNKHNYKIGEEEQKEICLSYMFHQPREEILKRFNITRRTYTEIIRKNKTNNFKILDEDITEMRQNFSKKTSLLIDALLERIGEEIKNKDKEINISQLTTSLGILKDKQSIELGQATSNNNVNVNIKIDT